MADIIAHDIKPAVAFAANPASRRSLLFALLPHATSVQILINLNVTNRYLRHYSEANDMAVRWEMLWLSMSNLKTMRWTIPAGGGIDDEVEPSEGLALPPTVQTLDLVVLWDRRPSFSLWELKIFDRLFDKLRHLQLIPLPNNPLGSIDLDLGVGQLPNLTSLHLACNEVIGPFNAPNLISLVLKLQCRAAFVLGWHLFDGCNQLQTVAIASNGDLNLNGCAFSDSLQSLCLDVRRLKCAQNGLSRLDFSATSALSLMQLSFQMNVEERIDLTAFARSSRQCSIVLQHGKCLVSMPPSEHDMWQKLADRSDTML